MAPGHGYAFPARYGSQAGSVGAKRRCERAYPSSTRISLTYDPEHMDEECHICERCGEILSPAAAVVRAVKLDRVDAMGDQGPTVVEGIGVFFHAVCYPTRSREYRRT